MNCAHPDCDSTFDSRSEASVGAASPISEKLYCSDACLFDDLGGANPGP